MKTCINHPDRKAIAKGLCCNCYQNQIYKDNPEYRKKNIERSRERYKNNKQYAYEWNKNKRLSDPITYKQKAKEQALKRLYNLTFVDFNRILLEQNNRCKICNTDNFGKKGPSVDHDHTTGKVRGILCGRCNKAIGLMDDSPNKLRLAAEYLDFNLEN